MLSDVLSTNKSSLPPRAGIALLTLQLRSALQDAATAESDDAGREQLRARLELLMEQRRRALDAALAQARAEAAAAVAAAQRAASVMVAQASLQVNGVAPSIASTMPVASEPCRLREDVLVPATEKAAPPVEQAVEPIVEVVAAPLAAPLAAPVAAPVPAPVAEVVETIVQAAVRVEDVAAPVEPVAEHVASPETIVVPSGARPSLFAGGEARASTPAAGIEPGQLAIAQPTSHLVLDAEAFATIFATVFGTMLEERLGKLGAHLPVAQALAPAPAPAPVPVKQSFWTHAKHPDVILLGLTTAIVLVVLAAWLG